MMTKTEPLVKMHTQDRISPPEWLHPALTATCVLSILLPRGLIRLSSGAVIIGLFLYLVVFTGEQSRDAYLSGVSCALLVLRWIDLVGIHTPERDFWKKTDPDNKSIDGSWDRLKWFFFLWNNQRGVGWNIQPDCLPQAPSSSTNRSTFVRHKFASAASTYLGLDITQMILRYTYAIEDGDFFAMHLLKQIFVAWTSAFKLFFTISLLYSLGSAFTILARVYDPVDWPPIFGHFTKDAWSVRKMWGSCWHQMMRRLCAEAGRITKSICGFRTGSFASRYSQIWVGFAVSAAIHHAGAIVGMFEDDGWLQSLYFLVQPVGIMFEDGVMGIARRFGIRASRWTKLLGHLWVIGWFSWSLRLIVAFQPKSWAEVFVVPSLLQLISVTIENN
ncbi:membrane bound O-acyl transferase family-domain-containing protein [Cadophora sp. MPI-SDFR-AT-0126]|nr:membrane bound O-acyl transferase family-domain-containing protein [Leotiomycetes sp. MPI-SDFR-AT-0126]